MNKNSLIGIIKFFVFAAIAAVPLFFIKETVYPAIISKTALFQALVEAAFFLWLALAISDREYRPKRTPVFWAVSAFSLVLVITSALGADPWRSFWSDYERMFGVFAILHAAALALVISSVFSKKDARRLLWASIFSSFAVSLVAMIQAKLTGILPWVAISPADIASGVYYRPGSTFDNPSFLAGYILFNFFFALYLLMEGEGAGENKGKRKIFPVLFLLLSISANVYVLFLTQTRGAILGWGVGILVLLGLFATRAPVLGGKIFGKRGTYAAILALIIFSGATFWLTRRGAFWSGIPGLSRFRDVSVSLSSEELQPRLTAIRAAWKGFLDRPFSGWGWENFNIVSNKYYDPRSLELNYLETRFDKPHNFFMELLVAGGAPLALAFLALASAFAWEARRLRGIFGQIAVAAFAAYVIQNLFLFDTLGPALMLYATLGLVDAAYRAALANGPPGPAGGQERKYGKDKIKRGVFCVAAGAALLAAYSANALTVFAAHDEYWGFQYLVNGKVARGISAFRGAIDAWSPYRWNFVRDYATAMSQAYFYNGDVVPAEEVRWSVGEMEKVKDEHPLDAYNHYLLVDIYNQSSAIDPAEYLPRAEKEAAIALKLSPNRQEVYFSLAKTKYLEGKPGEALDLLKYALSLDENVPDAHFYYGIMSFAVGDAATGYGEIEKSMEMGRQWAIFYEPRTVAGLFADSGHHEEAVKLYREALAMQPQDTETQIKLAAAEYIFNGNKRGARDLLLEVAKKFDFRSSPSYPELKPILDDLGIQ